MESESEEKRSSPSGSEIVAEEAGSSTSRTDKGLAVASSSSTKKSSITHRPRSIDHMAENTEKANSVPSFGLPSPLKKQGARLRTFWISIKAKRPLNLIKRYAAQAATEAFQVSKDLLERLPNEAKVAMLVLLGICKLLFLLLLLGAGCKCKRRDELVLKQSLTEGPPGPRRNLSSYDSLAVCLSGDPRYLPFTGSSIVRHLMEPFPGPHVFISAHLNEHSHRLSVFSELSPKNNWQLVSIRVWAAAGVSNRLWSSMQPHMRREMDTIAMVNRWWLVEDSFRLVKEQEKKYSMKYKWVIQASFDQFWSAPVPHVTFDLDHEVAVPFTSTQGGLNEYAAVCQRRAAQRYIPRLEGLIRTNRQSTGVPGDDLRSSAVLFRLGLAPNMLQHVGFYSLPFCRLASSVPGAILVVGSLGAVDGFPCHPCKEVVRGQQGWALATKPALDGVALGPVPTVLPSQMDEVGVCYGKLPRFGPQLYQEWNAGLETGRLLRGSEASVDVGEASSTPSSPGLDLSVAAKELYSGAHKWQRELLDYRDCVARVKKLASTGALAVFGPKGQASVQGGATPESMCTRWLMGPVSRAGSIDWPVFKTFLTKDSIVYQFGVGNNIAFIKAITKEFNCHVHGFDETPRSIQWMKAQRLPMRFHHVPHMLGSSDGSLLYVEERDSTPTFLASSSENKPAASKKINGKSLKSILQLMKHNKIDVAVIDMRGADADILSSWGPGSDSPQICQLLVRHYDSSPSMTFTDDVPWQHLSSVGFVLASSIPVARGHLHLFYHPDVCLDPARRVL